VKEPVWVSKEVVLAAHDEMLAEHGGSSGIRDEGLLDSALGRPQNLFLYEKPTIFELASAYAFGLSKNHPFIDGKKRAAFLAAYIFLGRNGWLLSAPEVEATVKTLQLASGEISQLEFADWLKTTSLPITEPGSKRGIQTRRRQ
jgi:death-on-curing protein